MGVEEDEIIDRAELLALDDRQVVSVLIPEWGKRVRIRTLTGDERDAIDARTKRESSGKDHKRAILVAAFLSNANGTPLCTEADIAKLGAKNSIALDRVYWEGLKLNRMRQVDVDEMIKN